VRTTGGQGLAGRPKTTKRYHPAVAPTRSADSGTRVADARHVFIVGLPRTGSTLTRGMLNASPLIWVAGESHYFDAPIWLGTRRRPGFRRRVHRAGDLRTDEGIGRVVDMIWRLEGKSFWARLNETVDRGRFEADLRASERTDRALLDLAMGAFARGRRIRGEKTPEHIHAVPTLLDWFPNARVVHTFRDPRAVYVSLRRKEVPARLGGLGRLARRLGPIFDGYAISNLVKSWRTVAALHRRYETQYPGRYLLIRFEELVAEPRSTVERLCDFLGIDFSEEMLEQVVHNSSYLPRGATAGIDRRAVDRWRAHLSPAAERWFARLCGRAMATFGYEP
jgi:Sulfotransferase family